MFLLIFLVLAFCLWLSVCIRLAVLHPFLTIFYGIRDAFNFFRYKKWRACKTGHLIAYTALFGKGKTLSVVHYVIRMYKKYNNKKVYDLGRKKWVTQKVHILSNVTLSVPYEEFESLGQVVRLADENKIKDELNDTLTVTLVLGDEFSVQMNSRSFKNNIDPLFLNTLLTCRHHHISLIYDAQRFQHVDALLRQVTSYVVSCKKVWRFVVHSYYDAYQLECASDPSLVKPYKRTGFFVRDRDYNAYDTLACVGNLKKSVESGDMLSEEEIIALRTNAENIGIDNVSNPSRRLKKNQRRRR